MTCYPQALAIAALLFLPGWSQQVSTSSPTTTSAGAQSASAPRPSLSAASEDAPMPDLGTVPAPPNPGKSRTEKVLDKVVPRCVDAVFHTCWALPPDDSPIRQGLDPRFTQNMEVGDYYLKTKNLAGAESRFREALEIRPRSPAATFKLAQTLDKLHKAQEARETYQLYLKLQPAGPFAKDANQALQRFEKSDRNRPDSRKPH